MHWLKTDGRDLQTEIIATKRRGRVLIRFKRFPELRGILRGIVLDVMVKGDPPGTYVFAKDCLALYDEQEDAFYCGFCDPDDRVNASSRQEQYVSHLYEPFRAFVNGNLRLSESGRKFRRMRNDELGHRSPRLCDQDSK